MILFIILILSYSEEMMNIKILSVEPTPSPNVMKLNMDESLPAGMSSNYTLEQHEDAPEWIQRLFGIDGIKGVFQVSDFIAIERHPKADWKEVLSKVRSVFGAEPNPHAEQNVLPETSFGEIQVLVQMFKGIPTQVKLLAGTEEKRFGLPDRFRDSVMRAQVATQNYILERTWEDHGVRYGSFQDVGEELVQELSASYNEDRLEKLVHEAKDQEGVSASVEAPLTIEQLSTAMNDSNWERRFAALEKMNPTLEDIPILFNALADPKPSIRRLAAVYLGMIGKPEVLPYLIRALKDSSASVRRTAGDALSDIGDPSAIAAMTEALRDPNKLVRWRAARFLYEVGDDTAVTALESAQHDEEFEVSLQAKMALERIERGESASGTVWQQMTRNLEKPNN
jgi:hypothetical protein